MAAAGCGGTTGRAVLPSHAPSPTATPEAFICGYVIGLARETAPWIASDAGDARVDAKYREALDAFRLTNGSVHDSLSDAVLSIRKFRYEYALAVVRGGDPALTEATTRHAFLSQLAKDEAACNAAAE